MALKPRADLIEKLEPLLMDRGSQAADCHSHARRLIREPR
jgi:hypothetical protein